MKNKTKIILLACVLSVFSISCTSSIVEFFKLIGRMRAGLSEKSILVNGYKIFYLEGGKGEAVLLVHGFGAEKDNWVEFSKYITQKHRVVAVDLPGFGESTKNPKDKFDYESQSKRLHMFVRKIGLTKYHIAGSSMGGGISAEYAALYPDEVLSLGLFAPHGFKCPVMSMVEKELKKGNNPLVVKSPPDTDRLMDYLFVIKPSIPSPLKSYFTKKAIENSDFNMKVFNDINKRTIDERMGNVRAKTLILWGDKDQVIDVTCASRVVKEIKNSRVVIMANCGHTPMVERPMETAKIYLDFIARP